MHVSSIILLALSSGATAAVLPFDVPVPARVRDAPTPTGCTASAIATETTINRGNEGIWVVGPSAQNLNVLYKFRQTDWLDNDHQKILDTCGNICLEGNNTAEAGTWLPSEKYFQGAFVNTPGGNSPDHLLWQCACYDRAVTQDDLVPGGGTWNNANPGSGTILNRKC
ncbi:hypothetical protein K445DRAFT_322840 [Daldinia sp. EC12]|nr:hypothetical protein F4774DRAFT_368571 [Daldinia eschscholtzii]OTB10603.1 hypothetical protein K445DRAFT_322840 [Daldinia sp. EC12]